MNIRIVAIIAFLILILMVLLYLVFARGQTSKNSSVPTIPSFNSSPSSNTQPTTNSFSVLSTSPADKATDVSTGEIGISFTTNQLINSAKDFTLTISPPLPFYWQFTNSYPTNTVMAHVLGGLKTNTTYTLSVLSSNNIQLYSWSFTTSSIPSESASGLVRQQEQQLNQQYFPLSNFTPYSSADFNVIYTNKLTLQVTIKNPDVNKVKQEVTDWITSHGVEPNTHIINYVNDF